MDPFFEADAYDPKHWRYWKPLIIEQDGAFHAKVRGEVKPISDPRFITPRNKHEAAEIATFLFGGRPLPRSPHP